MLLLHGLSDSWRSFELALPHLPDSIRVFALSLRGHGDSRRPEAGYHFRDFAADVAAFMDALDLESTVVVGHSMGSAVA
ncbi:MAG: alpha/beta fold hydrolase [Azospirillaceae bacterium]